MDIIENSLSVKSAAKPSEPQIQVNLHHIDQLYRKVIQEDDYKGFELIFKHYYNTLCHYALRYVTTKEAARDVVSEVFYKFWKNRSIIDVKISCRAYLFTAVKHQACNYLSREFRKDVSIETQCAYNVEEAYNPEELLVYEELQEKLESAIHSLTPQCKTVFMLSRFQGMKYNEIAEQLQISQKAVEAQISRALKLLRPLVRIVVVCTSFAIIC